MSPNQAKHKEQIMRHLHTYISIQEFADKANTTYQAAARFLNEGQELHNLYNTNAEMDRVVQDLIDEFTFDRKYWE